MTSPFAAYGRRPMPSMPSQQPKQGIDMAQLRNLYQSVFKSGNPMQAMQQMMMNNPKLAQINNLMRMGRSPESLFREMAAQRGIDPDQFIRELQGNVGK